MKWWNNPTISPRWFSPDRGDVPSYPIYSTGPRFGCLPEKIGNYTPLTAQDTIFHGAWKMIHDVPMDHRHFWGFHSVYQQVIPAMSWVQAEVVDIFAPVVGEDASWMEIWPGDRWCLAKQEMSNYLGDIYVYIYILYSMSLDVVEISIDTTHHQSSCAGCSTVSLSATHLDRGRSALEDS